nr:glycosyltransferase family 2 protein [uncultured Psychroserpens sp.]
MKTEAAPLVSICIPTYEGSEFLLEALNSALVQTYKNIEIIISDDASKDNTLVIVESFKSKTDIPIRVFHHQPNGIGANWNNCIKNSNGDFIKFLFQDDILYPNCIEKMMHLMLSNPKVGLVYSKRDFMYETLNDKVKDFVDYYGNLHTYWENIKVEQGVLPGKIYLSDAQFLNSPKNKIGEPTNVLLRKCCFDKIRYFSTELQQALDCDYWYRVMKHYDIGFIDEVLVAFRLHDKQASSINKQRDIPDNELLYKNYYELLFWQLHPKNRMKLLKLFNPIVRTLVRFKYIIKN